MAEISEPLNVKRASRDRFARIAATCAIVVTLAGAAIGYLQSEEGKAGGRAGAEAQTLSVKTFGELARLKAAARVQVELFIRSQVLQARAASALEQELVGPSQDRSAAGQERRRWLVLAREIDARASRIATRQGIRPIASDPRFSPSGDPAFPSRYLAAVVEGRVSELQALRDAANREAAERGKEVAAYVAILALLAVSVYLFGFSLTPHGEENRAVFVGAAGVLGLVGLAWAVGVLASGADRAPRAAATALARGDQALFTQRFTRAQRFYDRSIELDPDSGHAYFGRSTAEFFAGSPDYFFGNPGVLTSPEALQRSAADAKRALELGSSDPTLLGNAGFMTIMLGAQQGSEALVREGLAMAQQAERQPRGTIYPIDSYNSAFASLVLGDETGAREAYRRAIRRSQGHGRSGRFWSPAVLQSLVGAGLTELEQLGRLEGPEGRALARTFKEGLVGRAWDTRADASTTPPAAKGADLGIAPSYLELRLDSYPWKASDSVVVAWYRHEPGLGWYTLPNAVGPTSGPVDYLVPGSPGEFQWLTYPDPGGVLIRRYHLRDVRPASCLGSGLYKAEVYVNGRLALTKTHRTQGLPTLTPVFDRGTGYRICRRPEWRPARDVPQGLVSGFVDREKREGVLVFRLSVPPEDSREVRSSPLTYVEEQIGRRLNEFSHILPPRPPLQVSQSVIAGGLSGEWVKYYADAEGQMIAYGGIAGNDSLLIGVVFGPDGSPELRRRLVWTGQSLTPP
jgi:hypothetical protein